MFNSLHRIFKTNDYIPLADSTQSRQDIDKYIALINEALNKKFSYDSDNALNELQRLIDTMFETFDLNNNSELRYYAQLNVKNCSDDCFKLLCRQGHINSIKLFVCEVYTRNNSIDSFHSHHWEEFMIRNNNKLGLAFIAKNTDSIKAVLAMPTTRSAFMYSIVPLTKAVRMQDMELFKAVLKMYQRPPLSVSDHFFSHELTAYDRTRMRKHEKSYVDNFHDDLISSFSLALKTKQMEIADLIMQTILEIGVNNIIDYHCFLNASIINNSPQHFIQLINDESIFHKALTRQELLNLAVEHDRQEIIDYLLTNTKIFNNVNLNEALRNAASTPKTLAMILTKYPKSILEEAGVLNHVMQDCFNYFHNTLVMQLLPETIKHYIFHSSSALKAYAFRHNPKAIEKPDDVKKFETNSLPQLFEAGIGSFEEYDTLCNAAWALQSLRFVSKSWFCLLFRFNNLPNEICSIITYTTLGLRNMDEVKFAAWYRVDEWNAYNWANHVNSLKEVRTSSQRLGFNVLSDTIFKYYEALGSKNDKLAHYILDDALDSCIARSSKYPEMIKATIKLNNLTHFNRLIKNIDPLFPIDAQIILNEACKFRREEMIESALRYCPELEKNGIENAMISFMRNLPVFSFLLYKYPRQFTIEVHKAVGESGKYSLQTLVLKNVKFILDSYLTPEFLAIHSFTLRNMNYDFVKTEELVKFEQLALPFLLQANITSFEHYDAICNAAWIFQSIRFVSKKWFCLNINFNDQLPRETNLLIRSFLTALDESDLKFAACFNFRITKELFMEVEDYNEAEIFWLQHLKALQQIRKTADALLLDKEAQCLTF